MRFAKRFLLSFTLLFLWLLPASTQARLQKLYSIRVQAETYHNPEGRSKAAEGPIHNEFPVTMNPQNPLGGIALYFPLGLIPGKADLERLVLGYTNPQTKEFHLLIRRKIDATSFYGQGTGSKGYHSIASARMIAIMDTRWLPGGKAENKTPFLLDLYLSDQAIDGDQSFGIPAFIRNAARSRIKDISFEVKIAGQRYIARSNAAGMESGHLNSLVTQLYSPDYRSHPVLRLGLYADNPTNPLVVPKPPLFVHVTDIIHEEGSGFFSLRVALAMDHPFSSATGYKEGLNVESFVVKMKGGFSQYRAWTAHQDEYWSKAGYGDNLREVKQSQEGALTVIEYHLFSDKTALGRPAYALQDSGFSRSDVLFLALGDPNLSYYKEFRTLVASYPRETLAAFNQMNFDRGMPANRFHALLGAWVDDWSEGIRGHDPDGKWNTIDCEAFRTHYRDLIDSAVHDDALIMANDAAHASVDKNGSAYIGFPDAYAMAYLSDFPCFRHGASKLASGDLIIHSAPNGGRYGIEYIRPDGEEAFSGPGALWRLLNKTNRLLTRTPGDWASNVSYRGDYDFSGVRDRNRLFPSSHPAFPLVYFPKSLFAVHGGYPPRSTYGVQHHWLRYDWLVEILGKLFYSPHHATSLLNLAFGMANSDKASVAAAGSGYDGNVREWGGIAALLNIGTELEEDKEFRDLFFQKLRNHLGARNAGRCGGGSEDFYFVNYSPVTKVITGSEPTMLPNVMALTYFKPFEITQAVNGALQGYITLSATPTESDRLLLRDLEKTFLDMTMLMTSDLTMPKDTLWDASTNWIPKAQNYEVVYSSECSAIDAQDSTHWTNLSENRGSGNRGVAESFYLKLSFVINFLRRHPQLPALGYTNAWLAHVKTLIDSMSHDRKYWGGSVGQFHMVLSFGPIIKMLNEEMSNTRAPVISPVVKTPDTQGYDVKIKMLPDAHGTYPAYVSWAVNGSWKGYSVLGQALETKVRLEQDANGFYWHVLRFSKSELRAGDLLKLRIANPLANQGAGSWTDLDVTI